MEHCTLGTSNSDGGLLLLLLFFSSQLRAQSINSHLASFDTRYTHTHKCLHLVLIYPRSLCFPHGCLDECVCPSWQSGRDPGPHQAQLSAL